MKVSDHFELNEFIDPVTLAEIGDDAVKLIDSKLFAIAELLRKVTGKPVVINGTLSGHTYTESGYRRQDSPTGAKKSAHKEGKAIDCKVVGMSTPAVHTLILAHEKAFYDVGVRQMEDVAYTPTWTHLSTRGIDNTSKKIQIIKP